MRLSFFELVGDVRSQAWPIEGLTRCVRPINPGLADFLECGQKTLRNIPFRIMLAHFAQIGNVTDVIASLLVAGSRSASGNNRHTPAP